MNEDAVVMKWDSIKNVIFWDRDVSREAWVAGFEAGHRSYLPQTLLLMQPKDAAFILGKDRFIRVWPLVRANVDAYPDVRRRAKIWDAAWSHAVSGTYSLPVLSTWGRLTPRRRALLIWISQNSGQSIYAAAKSVGLTYKRAYEHVKALTADGWIRQTVDTEGPRRRNLLFAAG